MKTENVEDIYELSPLQQGMLFHTLYTPKSGTYFQQARVSWRGGCNISALERAWQTAVKRHPVLRTSFHWEDLDKPLQVVHRHVDLELTQLDLRKLPREQQQARLEAWLREDRRKGFELSKAPLMRLTLFRATEDTLIWSHHHMLLDGWSAFLVSQEVARHYAAYCRGEDPRLEASQPYGDYIAWLQRQDMAKAEEFWRRTLAGFATPTPVVVDNAPTPSTDEQEHYEEQEIWLFKATSDALRDFARRHQLTMNTLFQGAWALLLSRYSGERDVLFGVTVAGRPASLDTESMVGLFINTLPMRARVPPGAELVPWLEELQDQQAEVRQYEYSPLVQVQGWSAVPRGTALFESILVFENHPGTASLPERGDSEEITHTPASDRTGYPLTVLVFPGPELGLRIIYDARRFETSVISRMLGHLRTLLEGMVAAPGRRLCELPLLTEVERRQLLVAWNSDTAVHAEPVAIHRRFETQVERTPEGVALLCGEERLTYGALNRRANQLAHFLRAKGVGPDVLVGLCLERSADMVVALLGILKAGGAYLPLDPSYPADRLGFMVEDARVPIVVTRQGVGRRLAERGAEIVGLDADRALISREPRENPSHDEEADHLAYVIYTSGSTGRPKGVAMPHGPLANLLSWQSRRATRPDGIRTLQFSPLSFDVSFQEIASTLCSGQTLVLISEETRRDVVELAESLAHNRIGRLFMPFSALQQLAKAVDETPSAALDLREVITAGEQLQITHSVANLFRRMEECTLDNQYGPTEAHVVTAFKLEGAPGDWPALPPIGRPITNAQIYLLDSRLRPVPIGVPGELYIGGACLARGYLRRPALTAAKFIPHPFSDDPGARLYRSGDLACYRPDGSIEFLGRIDHQVKLRGFRIEPGEVEVALTRHPAIREAVVVAREDVPGDRRLVAYIVHDPEPVPPVGELRRFLQRTLPDYMLPTVIVPLEFLPLAPSGKVDRRSLPAPDTARPDLEGAFVAPRTATEETLAAMWREVLNLEQVGIHDDFFELGGHSLLATKLVSRIRTGAGVELPLRSLFETPTVAGLAETVETLRWVSEGMEAPPESTEEYEGGVL